MSAVRVEEPLRVCVPLPVCVEVTVAVEIGVICADIVPVIVLVVLGLAPRLNVALQVAVGVPVKLDVSDNVPVAELVKDEDAVLDVVGVIVANEEMDAELDAVCVGVENGVLVIGPVPVLLQDCEVV